MGIAGMSKSEVSRLCAVLDGQVQAFLTRRLDAEYPYVYVDARYEHVREDDRVQSMAVQIAYGIRSDGVREVLGLEVTASEDLEHWRTFLQSLVARGVRGVRLVVSDSHVGLRQAISEVFLGASWQRCRVHVLRNMLSHVPKSAQARRKRAFVGGGGHGQADLSTAEPGGGSSSAGSGMRTASSPIPQGGRTTGAGGGGDPRLL